MVATIQWYPPAAPLAQFRTENRSFQLSSAHITRR